MDLIIGAVQFITHAILYLPINFFFRVKAIRKLQLEELKRGLVLTANHQSRMDLILIFAAIPPKHYIKLLPMYGLVAEKYMNTWWKKLVLTLLGCYPLRIGDRETAKALLFLLDKIDRGKTILLFPEGRIIGEREVAKANPGIGYLALRRRIKILPIHLSGFRDVELSKTIIRKYHARVILGQPQSYFREATNKPTIIADRILSNIYKLEI
jgi:1-acyl-sn-glycerol-3-phosphate acyltransferase